MKCGICLGAARKTALVYAPTTGGILRRVRACLACQSQAIVVVPLASAPCLCACGASVARVCEGCASSRAQRSAVSPLAPALKQLRARAKVYEQQSSEFARGLAEGLYSASSFLETGSFVDLDREHD